MRRRRLAASLLLAGAAALAALSCHDPAVRERVLMKVQPDGSVRLEVDTVFKQGAELPREDREEIRKAVDSYALGRDPWLRGFERAGARDIVHERRGSEEAPESIRRRATLVSVESVVQAMPDAIANFKLERDDARAVESRIREEILPRPLYELRWSAD